jgi:hypothetical protein
VRLDVGLNDWRGERERQAILASHVSDETLDPCVRASPCRLTSPV